jgi:hypothetical protein
MVTVNSFYFLKNASAKIESEVTYNSVSENLTLQVDGNGAGISIKVLGCSDMASDSYYEISGISGSLEQVDAISENGIYQFNISGISKVKISLASISSGSVTVFGKMTKTI